MSKEKDEKQDGDPSVKSAIGTEAQRPIQDPIFAPAPPIATQEAVENIRFDFNNGLRVSFPAGEQRYRCVFFDADTDVLLYSMEVPAGSCITSVKKYFVRFCLEIYKDEEKIFTHLLDLKDKDVLLQFPVGAIGDTIAWFSFVPEFQRRHGCKLAVSMDSRIADLFRAQYPEIRFITKEEAEKECPYGTYNLGLYFQGDTDHQPCDFRQVGLHHTVAHILGLYGVPEQPPKVDLSAPRQIPEKYVCLAAQASSLCKCWNHPQGWREVVAFLKDQGYRVLCIDRFQEYGQDFVWNRIPYGAAGTAGFDTANARMSAVADPALTVSALILADKVGKTGAATGGAEDFTGDIPLQERINLIKDADLFLGLTSGLSWIAWCCSVPIIMIAGFTDPVNEFQCHRVENFKVCHGCWNDTRCEFDHKDFLWCPRKEQSRDKFECTKAITPKMVIDKIKEVLGLTVSGRQCRLPYR
jgi:autotransporter strand-loop-strand O-heptosyltransferase